MVDLADAVDADGKSFLSRLDLQGQIQRIMTLGSLKTKLVGLSCKRNSLVSKGLCRDPE